MFSFAQIELEHPVFPALRLFQNLEYFGPKVIRVKTALESVQVKSIHKNLPKMCPNITQEIAFKSKFNKFYKKIQKLSNLTSISPKSLGIDFGY